MSIKSLPLRTHLKAPVATRRKSNVASSWSKLISTFAQQSFTVRRNLFIQSEFGSVLSAFIRDAKPSGFRLEARISTKWEIDANDKFLSWILTYVYKTLPTLPLRAKLCQLWNPANLYKVILPALPNTLKLTLLSAYRYVTVSLSIKTHFYQT